LYPWLRRAAALESVIFAALLAVWIAPGAEGATTVFGWAHGVGYLALLFGIFAGVLRHEVPFWLLAATFTPLGPIGSLAGFWFLDRHDTPKPWLADQQGLDTPAPDV
jgi:hypothetical protein